jgi:hypothetical protein
MRLPSFRARRWLPSAGLAAGIGVVLLVGQTGAGHSLMRATGLEKVAQPYTALYFTDPGVLRTRIPLGHVAFDVAFTVQNETQTTNTYNWTVELVDGKRTTRAAAGQQIMRGGIGAVPERAAEGRGEPRVACRVHPLHGAVR